MPPSIQRSNAKHYKAEGTITEVVEYEGRAHPCRRRRDRGGRRLRTDVGRRSRIDEGCHSLGRRDRKRLGRRVAESRLPPPCALTRVGLDRRPVPGSSGLSAPWLSDLCQIRLTIVATSRRMR